MHQAQTRPPLDVSDLTDRLGAMHGHPDDILSADSSLLIPSSQPSRRVPFAQGWSNCNTNTRIELGCSRFGKSFISWSYPTTHSLPSPSFFYRNDFCNSSSQLPIYSSWTKWYAPTSGRRPNTPRSFCTYRQSAPSTPCAVMFFRCHFAHPILFWARRKSSSNFGYAAGGTGCGIQNNFFGECTTCSGHLVWALRGSQCGGSRRNYRRHNLAPVRPRRTSG